MGNDGSEFKVRVNQIANTGLIDAFKETGGTKGGEPVEGGRSTPVDRFIDERPITKYDPQRRTANRLWRVEAGMGETGIPDDVVGACKHYLGKSGIGGPKAGEEFYDFCKEVGILALAEKE